MVYGMGRGFLAQPSTLFWTIGPVVRIRCHAGRDHRQENCKALVKAPGVAQEGRAPPEGCGHAPVFSAPLRANAGLGPKIISPI